MELTLVIYAINMGSKLLHIAQIGMFVLLFVIGVIGLFYLINGEEGWMSKQDVQAAASLRFTAVTALKHVIRWLVIVIILIIVIPSEKTSYMMVAAYAAQTLSQRDGMDKVLTESSKISNKVLTIINNKLDTYVNESITAIDKSNQTGTK